MASHSAAIVATTFRNTIQKAVRCLDRTIAVVPSTPDQNGVVTLAPSTGQPIPLRGAANISFAFGLRYGVVRIPNTSLYRVALREYIYTVHDAGTPVFAYHWHPVDRKGNPHPAAYPHMHVYEGARTFRKEVADAHFITGRLALEEVLACVIVAFDVQPANGNWQAIFARNVDHFVRERSWPGLANQSHYRIV